MSEFKYFEIWKEQLRLDCEREQKLLAFEALPDDVLKQFWLQGLHPSVKAIVESGKGID